MRTFSGLLAAVVVSAALARSIVAQDSPEPSIPGASDTKRRTWSTADAAYREGAKLLAAGKIGEAEEALGTATLLAPKHAPSWALFGLAAFRRHDGAAALERLNRAIALDPASRGALFIRGLLNFGLRHYGEALADFQRVVRLPGPPGLVTDPNLARRRHREYLAKSGGYLSFDDAVRQGVLDVDAEAVYARLYGHLCLVLSRGPGFQQPVRVETAHHVVLCDGSEGLARLLADHLEVAHRAFRDTFGVPPSTGPASPFVALVFPDSESYRRYVTELTGDSSTPRITKGSYHSPSRQLLLVGSTTDLDGLLRLTYHEGFHQFMDAFFPEMPPWFAEGLAEYFAASRMGDGRLLPGEIHPTRLPQLEEAIRTLALSEVLGADHRAYMARDDPKLVRRASRVALHYAYSWGFVHFLMTSDGGARRKLLREMLAMRLEGASPMQATARAFPASSLPALEAEFKKYVKSHLPAAPK